MAVNDDSPGLLTKDRILDRLRLPEKLWLESLELHQHTQQRRDDFFARENQHRAQRNQPDEVEPSRQLVDPGGFSGVSGPRLRYSGTDVHPLRHQSEGR